MQTKFAIGEWTLDTGTHRLSRGSECRVLDAKAQSVLLHLVEDAPNVVTTSHLLDRHWPDVVVGDNVVHQAIAHLRKALGDDARSPRYIETLPKRGYRLLPGAMPSRGGFLRRSRSPGTALGLLAVASVLMIALGLWLGGATGARGSSSTELLFRPLQTTGSEPLDSSFVQGLQDEIVRRMAGIPRFTVRLHGGDFGAGGGHYVLSGSARMFHPDSTRLTVTLARGDRIVWSQALDAELTNPLAAQTSIAARLARAMRTVAGADSWLWQAASEDASVALLQGLLTIDETPGALTAALSKIDQAIHLDPDFAPALAAKAAVYLGAANWHVVDTPEAVARMKPLIRDALSRDPYSGFAWSLQARIHWYDLEFDAAETARRTALRYGSPEQWLDVAEQLNFCGRSDEALTIIDRALQADPANLLMTRARGSILTYARRYGEALAVFEAILADTPDDERTRHWAGSVLESLGRYQEAAKLEPWNGIMKAGYERGGVRGIGHAFLDFAEQIEHGQTLLPPASAWLWEAQGHARLGAYSDAVRAVEAGWHQDDRWHVFYLRAVHWPGFDGLRAHPEFRDLMTRTVGHPVSCPGFMPS